jgi:hypothetical protein
VTSALAPTAAAGRHDGEAASAAVRWAVIGTLLLALALLVDLQRLGGSPLGFVQPAQDGPAAGAFAEDFPTTDLPGGVGLDGQMTYAIARDPWPVDASAEHLDRPRYRLQRPLLSWVAGALHPGGGGTGLVWTLVAVGLVGVGAGAWAVGRLSATWGGPAWLGVLFPVLPGCFMSVRVSTADALGVGLALLAVALAARRRTTAAVLVGVLAVLAKEPTILVLAGWALAHRTRRDAAVAVVPAAVAAGWMAVLRLAVPGEESLNGDIGLPFVGLARAAVDIWSEGRELWGLASTVLALVLAAAALWRGRLRHPLGWAVAVNLAFVAVAGPNPLGTSFGGTRTGLALSALALIVLVTPRAERAVSPSGAG